jgi:hypothetical protein
MSEAYAPGAKLRRAAMRRKVHRLWSPPPLRWSASTSSGSSSGLGVKVRSTISSVRGCGALKPSNGPPQKPGCTVRQRS